MTKKRSIAFVLALLMCLTLLPAGVLAADDPVEVETPGGEVENTITWTDSATDISYAADGGIATVTGYTGTGTKLTIPDTVTYSSVTYKVATIGYEALKGLSINELVLGANVTALRGGAVADCFSLTKVTVTSDIGSCDQDYCAFSGSGANMEVVFASGVTKVPANFMGCADSASGSYPHVVKVTLADTVKTIGGNAFRNCADLATISCSVSNSKLRTIGEAAFYKCAGLTAINLPKSVVTLGHAAFGYCKNVEKLTINGNINSIHVGSSGEFNGYDTFWGLGSDVGAGVTVTFSTGVSSIPANMFCVSTPSIKEQPNVNKIIFQGNAPAIGAEAFGKLEATAFVPSENTTWTEANMLATGYSSEGGFLTWQKGDKVKITTQPADVASLVAKKVSFTVKVTGTSPKYQWQVSTDDGTTWTDISGADKATYTISSVTTAMDGNLYRCVVSNSLNTVKSTGAKLTVMVAPGVTTHPSDVTQKEGRTVKLTVKATGGNLKYQWYMQENGTTFWTKIKGATKATYAFSAERKLNKYHFRCRISNDAGAVYSNPCQLTVVCKPVIKTQPSNRTGKVGGSVTFKVKASGTALKYQWYMRSSAKGDWKAIAGETTASLTISGIKKGWKGRQYRCRVYNDAGIVYTKAATLSIK